MADNPTPSLPDSLIDEGLRCPACEYNLTGLADRRCPECGATFEPQELRARLSGVPSPVIGWDDGQGFFFSRLLFTCLATWFHPLRFGRRFPAIHVRRTAMHFRAATLFLALGIYCLEIAFNAMKHPMKGEALGMCLAIGVGIVAGVFACELLLWAIFALSMRRRTAYSVEPLETGSSAWRGIIGYYRSSLVISAIVVGSPSLLFQRGDFTILAIYATIFWWWICLGASSFVMAKPGVGRILAMLLIPVAAVGAIFVGTFVGWTCAIPIFRLRW